MFAHKINELSFNEKITKCTVFSHISKISGENYNYKIADIELGKPQVNDSITLQNLEVEEDIFSVEPEWFNQRIKNITFYNL